MSEAQVPAVVLGAAGYVGGELLRILRLHPRLEVVAAVSRSQAGRPIHDTFAHLRSLGEAPCFCTEDDLLGRVEGAGRVAIFSCLPHGEAAATLQRLARTFEAAGVQPIIVDLSADFRLPNATEFRAVYGQDHGAPGFYDAFHCALPDLATDTPQKHLAHPGCFTTAVTLGAAPLAALDLTAGPIAATAITGSTGSGRSPAAGTHHPERHGNLRAYKPLAHRHRHEMQGLLAGLGGSSPRVHFTPHSGPFARGIHATLHVPLRKAMTTEELLAKYQSFYSGRSMVSCTATPPNLKEVVGTNRCRIGLACDGEWAAIFSVIDNLTKGAAGGGVQWMNRLLDWAPETGLDLPGLGWN